ncbi:MAG: hypothetical protein CML73_03325 [Rhodobiaceae bacterium]|nr:hypothetical protein [Rhodobiaceae bacterium]
MDQLLDRFSQALSRLIAEVFNFVRPVESLLDSLYQTSSRLRVEALSFLKQVGSLLDKFHQFLSPLLAEALSFVQPIAPQLYLPMLGGLLLAIFLLLLALVRSKRANVHNSKVFEREITFEDISAETANSSGVTTNDASAFQTEPAWSTAPNTPINPTQNAKAQTNGFTFFKRKSGTRDCVATAGSDTSSIDGTYALNSDSKVSGDDALLAGLEQEMLATRQLYLDGIISKEVYISETRVLYQKAQTLMT